jgi:hypothetical protein
MRFPKKPDQVLFSCLEYHFNCNLDSETIERQVSSRSLRLHPGICLRSDKSAIGGQAPVGRHRCPVDLRMMTLLSSFSQIDIDTMDSSLLSGRVCPAPV